MHSWICRTAALLLCAALPACPVLGQRARILKDIHAGGIEKSNGFWNQGPRLFTAFGSGRLFFIADDDVHGYEPWVTDGTEAGTRMLHDTLPGYDAGACEGTTSDVQADTYAWPIPFAGGALVYFSARSSAGEPCVLWASDGVNTAPVPLAAGTPAAVFPGLTGDPGPRDPDGLYRHPRGFAELDGDVYFTANAEVPLSGFPALAQRSLFRIRGGEISRIEARASDGETLTGWGDPIAYHGAIYARCTHPTIATELCVFDPGAGTAGIALDLAGPYYSSAPARFRVVGDRLTFAAWTQATSRELFVTDGSESGTHVIDVFPGFNSGYDGVAAHAADGMLYFTTTLSTVMAVDPQSLALETLHTFDTYLPPAIAHPAAVWGLHADGFMEVGGRLLFRARDAGHGNELWALSGRPATATLFSDILPGAADGTEAFPTAVAYGTRAFFACRLLAAPGQAGFAGWQVCSAPFEGGAATPETSVRMVTNDVGAATPIGDYFTFAGRLFFRMDLPDTGPELWTYDPTATAVEEEPGQISGGIDVYPNPARDRVTVRARAAWPARGGAEGSAAVSRGAPANRTAAPYGDRASATLHDLLGRVVRRVALDASGSAVIPVEDLARGIYLLRAGGQTKRVAVVR